MNHTTRQNPSYSSTTRMAISLNISIKITFGVHWGGALLMAGFKDSNMGTSPVGLWLRTCLAINAGATGAIPGQGTKISHGTEQLRQHAATTEPE